MLLLKHWTLGAGYDSNLSQLWTLGAGCDSGLSQRRTLGAGCDSSLSQCRTLVNKLLEHQTIFFFDFLI